MVQTLEKFRKENAGPVLRMTSILVFKGLLWEVKEQLLLQDTQNWERWWPSAAAPMLLAAVERHFQPLQPTVTAEWSPLLLSEPVNYTAQTQPHLPCAKQGRFLSF